MCERYKEVSYKFLLWDERRNKAEGKGVEYVFGKRNAQVSRT
jgi:hypothetical protein